MEYICANCSALLCIEEIDEDVQIESGSVLGKCEECGKETTVLLLTTEDYIFAVGAIAEKHKLEGA